MLFMLAATGQIMVILSHKILLWFLHCQFSKACKLGINCYPLQGAVSTCLPLTREGPDPEARSRPLWGGEFKHITWNGFKHLLKLSHALLSQEWILSKVLKWLGNLYLLLNACINSEGLHLGISTLKVHKLFWRAYSRISGTSFKQGSKKRHT